jgi:MscS family membrane protein
MTRVEEVVTSPWTIAISILLGAVIAGRILVRIVRPLLASAASRTSATWDDHIAERLTSPFSLIIAIQAFRVALPWLDLDPRVIEIARTVAALVTTAAILWTAFRGIDIARMILEGRSWAVARPASRSLLAIGSRFAKVTVVLLGLIIVLAQLGVSVASLIAGLGIGGLALALAAQKTVENLFGTVSIGFDQPMREGDFIKVYDMVGTVEEIGLRSTRIRTLDRTLVTIPNGELANQRIESYTVRDRIRLACIIGLVYQTSAAQMRQVLDDLEGILRSHPKIWPDTVVVRFMRFADSSLDIEIMAWFRTTDWGEFQKIRQEVLLSFMDAIEQRGTAIAFPTRTLHLAQAPASSPPPQSPA